MLSSSGFSIHSGAHVTHSGSSTLSGNTVRVCASLKEIRSGELQVEIVVPRQYMSPSAGCKRRVLCVSRGLTEVTLFKQKRRRGAHVKLRELICFTSSTGSPRVK